MGTAVILGVTCSSPRWQGVSKTADGRLEPGNIISRRISFEQLGRERLGLIAQLGEGGYDRLASSGWLSYEDCPFPLLPGLLPAAERLVKVDAEWTARRQQQLVKPSRAWRDMPICQPCHYYFVAKTGKRPKVRYGGGWTGDKNEGGWEWKGVHSLPIGTTQEAKNIITCGMLKDTGVIASEADCYVKDMEARASYDREQQKWLKDRYKTSAITRAVGYYQMVFAAAYGIVASAVGGPAGAALASSALSSLQAIQKGRLGWKDGLALAASGMAAVPGIGVTGIILGEAMKAARSGLEISETIAARKDASSRLKARKAAVDASLRELKDVIEARASLQTLNAAVADLEAKVAQAKRENSPFGGGIPFLRLGIAALVLWRFR